MKGILIVILIVTDGSTLCSLANVSSAQLAISSTVSSVLQFIITCMISTVSLLCLLTCKSFGNDYWLGQITVLGLIAPRSKVGDITAIEKKLTESIHRTIFHNRKMSRILDRYYAKSGVAFVLDFITEIKENV